MVSRAHEVPPNPEKVLDDSVNGEEALRLAWRLEPAHLSFPLPGRLVGDLRSVVGVLPRIVDNGGHGGSMSGAIAAQFVRNQPVGFHSLSFQQLAKKAFGCTPIPTGLDEDVDHITVLVDGAPEILTLALDVDE